ncbi:metallophosphoesterase [Pedobacter sp. HMF7647]|uniref:Metallophosphoesterase n=1 Tax=Hufsiella arboris TaxID=2695275 RepID=A0A7K1Y6K7_9SPHI|nr:calcineurin-like phosphoesterase family protein [Hufsiella arboris]MXV50205.1 metallophosphoesterase [Hufsiella arboris]
MLRRHFLRNLGLLSAATTIPATVIKAAEPQFVYGLGQLLIKGRVASGAKGISGVAVTDGVNVVLTNSNGSYELTSNKSCRFVYISLPSGYEFPHENSVAKFYQKIDPSKSTFIANFNLTELSQSDEKHTFVVWADPQIQSKHDAELLLANSAPDLKALVENYRGQLLHGIGCGDLVWDNFNLFPDYQKAIAMSGLPFFNVIGNHDMDLEARTDEGSSDTFKDHFGPTYYSYNRGKIHYVVLDDVFFLGVAKKYIGYLTESQLQWLEQDLKNVKEGSTVVVSLHIPTNTGQLRRDKEKVDQMGGTVINRQHLYNLLKPYRVHLMSGHTHFNEKWEDGNITEHVHGTVCGAWWTGQICGDGTPNGYGVYEVSGNDVKWYYKATGHPKNYQLKIYSPGKHKEYPDEACINVWNYDKNWKIECFADGNSIGAPIQKTAYDPLAAETLLGADIPKPRGWVEPLLTDHLFFIKVPAGTKSLKVNATDRFGETFTDTLGLA